MDQNVDVLYPDGPKFSSFTTVIVTNSEADYLLNPWTYRNMGFTLVHKFFFQQLLQLEKIDLASAYGDRKHQKS
jgi:hypothetical protein